jgi:threonine dehydrogenase-like Zn-dependent dehydrogenase
VLWGHYPLSGPYPLGHEGVAESSQCCPADLVIVPFQISCGHCEPCRREITGNCLAHAPMSTYGLGKWED